MASFAELDLPVKITRVTDGIEAINFIRLEKNKLVNLAFILLDINLPRKNGIDVLAWVKSDNDLKSIPVVIFTSSRESSDISTCYNIGANAYVVKPLDFNEFRNTVICTGRFWCGINETRI
jgi:CheY-like chemotaxis protein